MRALLLLAAPALFACGEPPTGATGSSSTTQVDSGGGGQVVIDGVTIDVEGVAFRYVHRSSTGGPSTTERSIAGHEYELRDGVFVLGGVGYGAVRSGSTVLVTPEGVFVDGTPRGPLP